MSGLVQIEARDGELLAGIGKAMAESVRRSGEWVVCRPGCTQCCLGPFAITRLDELRLERGIAALEAADPDRARRVRTRAEEYVSAIAEAIDDGGLPVGLDDAPCPALDPGSGLCDLYEWRPVTCRTFGPATRLDEESVAACELCYAGANAEQIAQCAVETDSDGIEGELIAALGAGRYTIVARALAARP